MGEYNKGMAMDTGQCTISHAHDNLGKDRIFIN